MKYNPNDNSLTCASPIVYREIAGDVYSNYLADFYVKPNTATDLWLKSKIDSLFHFEFEYKKNRLVVGYQCSVKERTESENSVLYRLIIK